MTLVDEIGRHENFIYVVSTAPRQTVKRISDSFDFFFSLLVSRDGFTRSIRHERISDNYIIDVCRRGGTGLFFTIRNCDARTTSNTFFNATRERSCARYIIYVWHVHAAVRSPCRQLGPKPTVDIWNRNGNVSKRTTNNATKLKTTRDSPTVFPARSSCFPQFITYRFKVFRSTLVYFFAMARTRFLYVSVFFTARHTYLLTRPLRFSIFLSFFFFVLSIKSVFSRPFRWWYHAYRLKCHRLFHTF